jgi:hypothetical protein
MQHDAIAKAYCRVSQPLFLIARLTRAEQGS